jgi:hypothetical protein
MSPPLKERRPEPVREPERERAAAPEPEPELEPEIIDVYTIKERVKQVTNFDVRTHALTRTHDLFVFECDRWRKSFTSPLKQ